MRSYQDAPSELPQTPGWPEMDLTSRLSQNAGQVITMKRATKNCLKTGGSLQMAENRRNGFWNGRKCFRMSVDPTVGV
jgi:hypothetical protein